MTQTEILGYLSAVARRHGVDRMITCGVEVGSCTWECDTVVLAAGQLPGR